MAEEILLATIRAELSQFRREMGEAARIVERSSQESARAVGQLNSALGAVRSTLAALGVATGVAGVVALGKAALDTSAQFASFTLSLKNATGSLGAALRDMAFVRQEADRLGLNVQAATREFVALTNATRGTQLAGQPTKELFLGLSEASRTLGLSTEQYGRALLAVSQIALKGKVQQEELLQLAEAGIPVQKALADSLGVTGAALSDMLQKGEVGREALVGLGKTLRRDFGDAAVESSQLAQASFARLGNEVTQLGVSVGKSLASFFQPVADFIAKVLKDARESKQALEDLLPKGVSAPSADSNPQIQAELTERFAAIQRARDILTRLEERKESALFGASLGLDDLIRTQRDRVISLQKTYNDLLAIRQKVHQQFMEAAEAEQALDAGQTRPFQAQIAAAAAAAKALETQMKAVNMQAAIFGGQDTLAAARAQLKEVDDGISKLNESFIKTPGLLQQMPPELKKSVDQILTMRAQAEKHLLTVQETIEAQKDARKDAEEAAEDFLRQEKENVVLEKKLREETLALTQDQFATERDLLQSRADELRDLGVEETTIAAFYAAKRQDIATRELQHVMTELFKGSEARQKAEKEATEASEKQAKDRQKITSLISATEARGSQSRLDDLQVRLAKEREQMVALGATKEDLAAQAAAGTRAAQRLQLEETAQSLKEQEREYQRTFGGIQRFVGDTLLNILNGTITGAKDLLNSFRDIVLKALADLAAQALTRHIIVPIVGVAAGVLGQVFGVGGSAGGGGNVLGSLLGLGQQASSVSGALGGPTLSSLGGASGLTSLANTPLFGAQTAQGPLMANGAFFSGGGAAPGVTTLGTIGTAAAAGIGAGFALSEVNKSLGIEGAIGSRGSAALAGAGGGALAGTIILPGIGTAIGAVAGAGLGALFGGGGQRPPGLILQGATRPVLGLEEQGLVLGQTLALRQTRATNLGQAQLPLHQALTDAANQLLTGTVAALQQFPRALQEKALPALQGLADTFAESFQGLKFGGEHIVKDIERFVKENLPQTFQGIFGTFLKTLESLAPIVQQFDQAIAVLRDKQATLLATLGAARVAIAEGLFTPAESFETRQRELRDLVATVSSGTPAAQAAAAPRIAALAQEVFGLARQGEVFGDDLEALRLLQTDLLGILDTQSAGITANFDKAIQETEAQREILLQQVGIQETIANSMQQAVAYLATLTGLLQPVGSFQTEPGEVRRIPATGMALVHRGELIGRPAGDTFAPSISVTVHAAPGADAQAIGQVASRAIFRTIREIQRKERFRQTRTI